MRLTPADELALRMAGYAPTDPSALRWLGCEGYPLPAHVALAHARADAPRATSADTDAR